MTDNKKQSPGYINPVPDIRLQEAGPRMVIMVDNTIFKLGIDSTTRFETSGRLMSSSQQPKVEIREKQIVDVTGQP